MCSCIWLAPPRLAFFLAICGVGHPLTIIIIWFNKVVVVVVVMIVDDSFSRLTTRTIVHDSFRSAVLVITGPIAVRKHAAALFRREKFVLLQACLTGGH